MTYLMGTKLPSNRISIKDMKVARNMIPAAALISLSFKTGIVKSGMFSPNWIIFFILFDFD
jgi:hypothetical protein